MSQDILDDMVDTVHESVSDLLDLLERLGIRTAGSNHMDMNVHRLGADHQDSGYIEPFTARHYHVR